MKRTCRFQLYSFFVAVFWGLAICVFTFSAPLISPGVEAFPIPLKIGALLPLTGDLMNLGLSAKTTLEISKNDFQTEFPATTVELLIEDTKSDPDATLAAMKTLYNQGVAVFIGPLVSSGLAAVKSFADEKGLLVIDPTSSAPSLAFDDMIFRLTIPDTIQAKALVEYAKNREIGTVIPLYRQDTYGEDFYRAFKEKFAAAGGVTEEGIGYSVPLTDVSTILSSLKQKIQAINTPAEKIAVLCIAYDEAEPIFEKASGDPVLSSVKWLGTDSLSKSDIFMQNAAALEFADTVQFTASISTTQSFLHEFYPITGYYEDLITKVRKKSIEVNEAYVGILYDSLWLAALTLRDSADLPLKEAFLKATQSFIGYGLVMDFDPNGDRLYGYYSFYRLKKTGSQYRWSLTASFRIAKYLLDRPFYYYEYLQDQQDRVLKLGALLALTGSNAESGKNLQKTLELAKQNIGAFMQRYYTPGSRVEILIEDTASDPAVALQKMKALQQQGVQLFIGPGASAEVKECVSYAESQNLYILSPSSTSMALAKKDNVFRLMLNDQKQTKALAAYIHELGYTRIEPVFRNDVYGNGFAESLKTFFEELGGHCGEGVSYDPELSDFSLVAQSLNANVAAVQGENVAVLLVAYDEYLPIMQQSAAYPLLSGIRWFGTDSTAESGALSQSFTAADFAVKTRFTASIMSSSNFDICPYLENLKKDLSEAYGLNPTAYDVNAYDAAWIYVCLLLHLDWNLPTSPTDFLTAIETVLNHSVGYLQANLIDEFGDRLFGNFDFYQYSETGEPSSPNWKINARYIYFYGMEKLTWLAEEPASLALGWELYP